MTTDTQPIIDAARAGVDPRSTADGTTHFLVPEGWTRETHHDETRAYTPTRPRGTVDLFDLNSFVSRVQDLGSGGWWTTYADPDNQILTAVMNDDHAGEPGWRDHRVTYTLRKTAQWAYWTKHEGLHDQQAFAEIIEDGLDDIAAPEPARMLEIARTFTASIGTRFRQAARLRDGATQFVYEETIDAKGGESGEVTIPEEFRLLVAPFVGTAERSISARLRFRINSGQLAIGYALPLAERLNAQAFDEVVVAASEALGAAVLVGRAPEPTRPLG